MQILVLKTFKTLCNTLRQESELHGIICSGLQILIQENKSASQERFDMSDEEQSFPVRKANEIYTANFARENLNILGSSSKFLSVLSEVFLEAPNDSGGCLQETPSEQRMREFISAFLTEILLSLKETNKKTRNKAYDLLVEIGHACRDEERGGKTENLHQLFSMVAGGLICEKPHMVSAAIKGLARLAYEFSDLISSAYKLLPSSFLLLQRKNREIVKANLGLIKVLVANSKADGLETHLKGIIEGLLKWRDETKNQFKAKGDIQQS